MKTERFFKLALTGIMSGIIVVMTIVPFTGYIQYLPMGIEITTLHLPVIIGSIVLGVKGSIVLGGVWGLTCIFRALTNPMWVEMGFANPLISLVPRIMVGVVAAVVFYMISKRTNKNTIAAIVAALCGTLTNTILVLGGLSLFGGMQGTTLAEYFTTIIKTVIGINGTIELGIAVILTPIIYNALRRSKYVR